MKKEKIALQAYSVRDQLQEDFFGTLKKIKEYGYSGVEFAGLYGNDPLEVKKACEEMGLIPLSAHVPFAELMDRMEETIDCYKKLGVKYVVIPYLTPEYRPGTPGFQTVIDGARKIGEALAREGMVLQYHNHDFEFARIDGEYALDILYREVGPELLQTQLDTCWVNVGGVNPAEYVKKYAGRTPTVHLKDFAGSKSENMYALIGIDEDKKKETEGDFEFRPLGKGVQNFPAIVKAADEGGAEWFIVEQDAPSMGYTSLECAQISAKYLLENIAE
ncbi:sugar phosphate isomerase/epimerase family protein [Acetatifactor muris]|uniref:sugar phosphate isomerase/epimerase family protein n=1 Tax=Acetatifactor muris TaxID=879566 RepID=UPI0023EFCEE4|nr:sugar phosphate isomerase/epimerase [Acetatifactor muris]